MTTNIESRKYRLIAHIMTLDEAHLAKLEHDMKLDDESNLIEAIKPIRQDVSLDDLIAEQGYQPISSDDFFRLSATVEIEESLEDLLNLLRA